jgi:AcrR family transcriptional regulator
MAIAGAGGTESEGTVRRRVLDTAVTLIAAEGVENVSMRRIARAAGVSHQAPYHHFGDRSGVFAEINREAFDLLADRMDTHLTDKHGKVSPGELAAGCLRIYVETALEYRGHFRVMFRQGLCSLDGHPAADSALRSFAQLRRLVTSILPDTASTDEVDGWVMTVWSLSHGLATLLVEMSLDRPLPGILVEQHLDNVSATVRSLLDSAIERPDR